MADINDIKEIAARPIPQIEGKDADEWWSAYSRSMRKAQGEDWLGLALDNHPELGDTLLKAFQMAQMAICIRAFRKKAGERDLAARVAAEVKVSRP